MSHRVGLWLCFALAACSGGATLDLTSARLTAAEAREGCVASTLDVMQGVVDLFAPLTTADSLDDVVALAQDAGCALVVDATGTDHTLSCPGVTVRGESVPLLATLTFLAGDTPVADPADADRLVAFVETLGGLYRTEADLELRLDPLRGVVVDGFLWSESPDGCSVEGTLDNVAARPVADLPGVGIGVLFTSGNVELGVILPDRPPLTGTAALAGRRALVALEVDGIFSHGEIELGR
ncbi:MAG: hypothetical protein ACYTEZ_11940 [Planctomycetota bacterium]|jgi:hypothetical protein